MNQVVSIVVFYVKVDIPLDKESRRQSPLRSLLEDFKLHSVKVFYFLLLNMKLLFGLIKRKGNAMIYKGRNWVRSPTFQIEPKS